MDEAIWDGYYDEYRDNIDNYADWEDYDETLDEATRPVCMTGRTDSDEMTEADWDRYSREFEARYNEHLRSTKSSSPRRVGRACTVGKRVANRYYYDDNDDIGLYLPHRRRNHSLSSCSRLRREVQFRASILFYVSASRRHNGCLLFGEPVVKEI